jgi:hypothetical protein
MEEEIGVQWESRPATVTYKLAGIPFRRDILHNFLTESVIPMI